MYSYKINNSYTIYVNYEYLNECIKKSKKREKTDKNKKAKSIKPAVNQKRTVANIGSIVSVLNLDTQRESTYTIVHSGESDVSKSRISSASPVGNALIGHGVGEIIEVKVPSGLVKYKITGIK